MDEKAKTLLYVDMMSQPSRAVVIFCRTVGLPVQEVPVLIHKQDQRQPEYLKRNPLGKIPLLEVVPETREPFRLPESAAILAYLADVNQVPEQWLPRSNRIARAQVEAAMHWYHNSIRAGAMRIAFHKIIAKRLGVPPNEAVAEEGITILKRSLPELERVWLAGGRQPFVGGAHVCVADLLMCCELEQLTMLNKEFHGTDINEILAKRDVVKQWMAAVAAATAPHYEEVHKILRRVAMAGQGCVSPAQALPRSNL